MTTGRSLRIGEAVLGGGVLALGLFVAWETSLIRVAPNATAVSPRLFPYIVAVGLVLIGAALLREALAGHIAHEGGMAIDWRAAGIVAAALVVQLWLLEWIGWIVATASMFAAVAWAFGSRRLWLDVAIGVVLASLALAVFNYGLGLTLPAGSVFEQLMGDDDDS
jgi:putative tricarboxylic transport membrane protein